MQVTVLQMVSHYFTDQQLVVRKIQGYNASNASFGEKQ